MNNKTGFKGLLHKFLETGLAYNAYAMCIKLLDAFAQRHGQHCANHGTSHESGSSEYGTCSTGIFSLSVEG